DRRRGRLGGADRDLDQVLGSIPEDRGGDRLGLGLARLRVGGQHLVADLDLLDRLARAVGHQHQGAGRETVRRRTATAVGDRVDGVVLGLLRQFALGLLYPLLRGFLLLRGLRLGLRTTPRRRARLRFR